MVNEMLANIWTVDDGRNLERGEVGGRTNSGQHEELWSTEDTTGKDEFLGGVPGIEGCYQSVSASGTDGFQSDLPSLEVANCTPRNEGIPRSVPVWMSFVACVLIKTSKFDLLR